ncbi:MAG: hypothetical protein IJ746_06340 [Ruminococcus sp.]|nr:hypothetical protein [Ruminococcus sp.]
MKESNDLVARAKAGDFKKKSGAHQRVIAEEINSLKDDHREALMLYYYENKSVGEILFDGVVTLDPTTYNVLTYSVS